MIAHAPQFKNSSICSASLGTLYPPEASHLALQGPLKSRIQHFHLVYMAGQLRSTDNIILAILEHYITIETWPLIESHLYLT